MVVEGFWWQRQLWLGGFVCSGGGGGYGDSGNDYKGFGNDGSSLGVMEAAVLLAVVTINLQSLGPAGEEALEVEALASVVVVAGVLPSRYIMMSMVVPAAVVAVIVTKICNGYLTREESHGSNRGAMLLPDS